MRGQRVNLWAGSILSTGPGHEKCLVNTGFHVDAAAGRQSLAAVGMGDICSSHTIQHALQSGSNGAPAVPCVHTRNKHIPSQRALPSRVSVPGTCGAP